MQSETVLSSGLSDDPENKPPRRPKVLSERIPNRKGSPVQDQTFQHFLEDAGYGEAFWNDFQRLYRSEKSEGMTREELWTKTAHKYGWSLGWEITDGIRLPQRALLAGIRKKIKRPDGTYAAKRHVRINTTKVAGQEELLIWAKAAFGTDPEIVHKADIPSPAHLSMLDFANKNPEKFWRMINEIEERKNTAEVVAKTFHDDNRRLFAVMDAILEDRQRTKESQP